MTEQERKTTAVRGLIETAAREGAVCPANYALAEACGCHASDVAKIIARLAGDGVLSVERLKSRRRFVLANGQATDWSCPASVARTRAIAEAAREHLIAEARAGAVWPGSAGLARALACSRPSARQAIAALVKAGELVLEGPTGTRTGHFPALGLAFYSPVTDRREAVFAAIAAACRAGAVTPSTDDLAGAVGASVSSVGEHVRALHAAGRIAALGNRGRRIYRLPEGAATVSVMGAAKAKARNWATFDPPERRSQALGPTTDAEREAMLARFRAAGGEITRCPTVRLVPGPRDHGNVWRSTGNSTGFL